MPERRAPKIRKTFKYKAVTLIYANQ